MTARRLSWVCRNVGTGIDKINNLLGSCQEPWVATINGILTAMEAQYNVNAACGTPCNRNRCMNDATCTAVGFGYNCTCLDGYSGVLCDLGESFGWYAEVMFCRVTNTNCWSILLNQKITCLHSVLGRSCFHSLKNVKLSRKSNIKK